MQNIPPISDKQCEFIRDATHRWNVKTGATRSGKSYLDVLYTIPKRILERRGEDGLVVLLGNTKGTLQRNVLDPMAEIYGARRVSAIRSDNTATLFGERVYCLGADNKKHVDRLRGASIKYCYGDEVTTWNQGVFEMLKSRLDKPCSCFDGTCNPDSPGHWFKRFLDSGADIYAQAYTIDDNPYLPPEFVAQLKREYAGTVYYDRYIRGLWVMAEGLIYPMFANEPSRFIIDEAPEIKYAVIGVDFGGTGSAHSFTLTGITPGFQSVVVLDEFYHDNAVSGRLSPSALEAAFVQFVSRAKAKYRVYEAFCDSAEQTLIEGLSIAAMRARLGIQVRNAVKGPINDRIMFYCSLMGQERFKIMRGCKATIKALSEAVYKQKAAGGDDERLDDGSVNIDSLDSMEYSTETIMHNIAFGSLKYRRG